jgi:hypothetical protein
MQADSMTTLHDQIAEALKAARTGLCEWPAFGDDEKDVVLLAKIDSALSRLDALSAEVAELRVENEWLRILLRPFAKMAEYYDAEISNHCQPSEYDLNTHDPDSATAADAIAARAALAKGEA